MRPVWKRMRSILPLYAPHVAIFSSSDLYCIVHRSGAARCAPPPVLPVGSVCGCMAVELAGGCSAEHDPARRPGAVASARAHLLPLHRVRLFLTPSHVLSSRAGASPRSRLRVPCRPGLRRWFRLHVHQKGSCAGRTRQARRSAEQTQRPRPPPWPPLRPGTAGPLCPSAT